jgi:hypothetical protein
MKVNLNSMGIINKPQKATVTLFSHTFSMLLIEPNGTLGKNLAELKI